MESVAGFHVELLELMLSNYDAVWVAIDHFQVLQHILQIILRAQGVISHSWSDALAGSTLTAICDIHHLELGHVKVISVGSQLLAHQQPPVFKSGFLSTSQHQRVRDLGLLANNRNWRILSTIGCSIHNGPSYLTSISILIQLGSRQLLLQIILLLM